MAEVKDKKDKLLSKLYKRRVEIDFSRKVSSKVNNSNTSTTLIPRSIAASLTCCQLCGQVYLENYSSSLHCYEALPHIDFRGELLKQHEPIEGWSLTSYLMSLHQVGMTWESIYWHVWTTCIVLHVASAKITIGLNETDRYSLQTNGIIIQDASSNFIGSDSGESEEDNINTFTLGDEQITSSHQNIGVSNSSHQINIGVLSEHIIAANTSLNPTLNPLRPVNILTKEIFDLICTQSNLINDTQNKSYIKKIKSDIVASANEKEPSKVDLKVGSKLFNEIWGYSENTRNTTLVRGKGEETEEKYRGNARSRSVEAGTIKQRHTYVNISPVTYNSFPKKNASSNNTNNQSNNNTNGVDPDSDVDSDTDVEQPAPPINNIVPQRRSRSSGSNRPRQSATVKPFVPRPTTKRSICESRRLALWEDPHSKRIWQVLTSMPIEISQNRSKVYSSFGVWLCPHPLQLQDTLHTDTIDIIDSSTLTNNKKIEWELDTLRELDTRHMNALYKFLSSKRKDTDSFVQKKNSSHRSKNIEYYRDRGRQPRI